MTGERRGLQTYTYADLLEREPPTFLLDDIIPSGGFAMLYGAPGSYKSFIALDWALSVACGVPWLGRATRRAPVLYVAGEGFGALQGRVSAWGSEHGVTPSPDVHFVSGGVYLTETEPALDLLHTAGEVQPGLIVLDTWARVTSGAEENSATETGEAIRLVDLVRERTGAAVLVIHHARKDGTTFRGSSALHGALDAMVKVQRAAGGLSCVLKCEKQKEREEFMDITVQLRPVRLDETGTTSLSVARGDAQPFTGTWAGGSGAEADRRERVLDFIRANPGASRNRIAASFNMRKATVLAVIADLLTAGEITETEDSTGLQAVVVPTGSP